MRISIYIYMRWKAGNVTLYINNKSKKKEIFLKQRNCVFWV